MIIHPRTRSFEVHSDDLVRALIDVKYINKVIVGSSMISVSEDVVKLIESEGQDYRVCTACTGPALVPITVKSPKETDIKIPVGKNTLYVSRVQAQYITKVTLEMLYDEEEIDSCPAFYYRH